jgi:hypothetical protein
MKKFSVFYVRTTPLLSLCALTALFVASHLRAADISTFAFFESPSKPIEINDVTVKYKVAAAGLEARWANHFGSVGLRVGAGYNPEERATMSVAGRAIEMKGPVVGNYGRIELVAHPVKFSRVTPELALAHEAFDFSSDSLTGSRGDFDLTGSVAGTKHNSAISLRLKTELFNNMTGRAEMGYSRWNYDFSSHGVATSANLTARTSKDGSQMSDDPYYRLELGGKFLGQDLSFFYQTRQLSSQSGNTLTRYGANLTFRF